MRRSAGRNARRFCGGLRDELNAVGPTLVDRAHLETGLPLARLNGELGRTTGQLKLFADVLDEGSWANLRIDEAMPETQAFAESGSALDASADRAGGGIWSE